MRGRPGCVRSLPFIESAGNFLIEQLRANVFVPQDEIDTRCRRLAAITGRLQISARSILAGGGSIWVFSCWSSPMGAWIDYLGSEPSVRRFLPLPLEANAFSPTDNPFVVLAHTTKVSRVALIALVPEPHVLMWVASTGVCATSPSQRALLSFNGSTVTQSCLPDFSNVGVWSHRNHYMYPAAFRRAVWTLLLGASLSRRTGQPLCRHSPLHVLPSELLDEVFVHLARAWLVIVFTEYKYERVHVTDRRCTRHQDEAFVNSLTENRGRVVLFRTVSTVAFFRSIYAGRVFDPQFVRSLSQPPS